MSKIAAKITGKTLAALVLCSGVILLTRIDLSGSENQQGIVTYVDGMAKKQKLEEANWNNVIKNTTVISGERVRTFSESRAELEMPQLDIIRMSPKTTIDILKLYEESKEQVREAKIVLQSGDLWANVNKKSADFKLSINTPVAAAAITGTTLRLNVAADSSAEVKVYHGEVVLSNVPEKTSEGVKGVVKPVPVEGPRQVEGPRPVSLEEWSLIVKSMQKVKINSKGQVVQSSSFSQQDEDEKTDWVLWNQERDKNKKN